MLSTVLKKTYSKILHPCNDTIMHNVKQFKYLRVTFSFDTTSSAHINTVSLKARRLIGMLYCYADTSSVLIIYLTTV